HPPSSHVAPYTTLFRSDAHPATLARNVHASRILLIVLPFTKNTAPAIHDCRGPQSSANAAPHHSGGSIRTTARTACAGVGRAHTAFSGSGPHPRAVLAVAAGIRAIVKNRFIVATSDRPKWSSKCSNTRAPRE